MRRCGPAEVAQPAAFILPGALLDRNGALLASLSGGGGKGGKNTLPSLSNVCMKLRQLCNHPRLLDKSDAALPESGTPAAAKALAQLVEASGKMVLLHKLMPRLRTQGRKVLIFSQFTRMLDILEDYLHLTRLPYERLDGSVAGGARQASIDRFQQGDAAHAFAFLLSTRAGGVGINLTAADTVVIFDSDWNPQNDVQGMARCHRIGQTQQVQVYRLITNRTYERGMFERSCQKLGLDQALLGGDKADKGEKAPSGAEVADVELQPATSTVAPATLPRFQPCPVEPATLRIATLRPCVSRWSTCCGTVPTTSCARTRRARRRGAPSARRTSSSSSRRGTR